ncbi:hypothetical protein Sinac_3383 [Singulisphaera acidiphila DSM 18658]|uniref:Uncharacterized protein n=1 Tax=Singulisphaera acidiphila (strain ATCC BAA-1392 / DSM 18658 / VKM B-2454 / MOB10) TaxID=886293 RepID=L0DFK9_SINAD|nr:hypothetical protein Sinac_3383 [Singulisphaera acidiphila DSM 18658]
MGWVGRAVVDARRLRKKEALREWLSQRGSVPQPGSASM